MTTHLSRWAWAGLLSALLLAVGGIMAFSQTATLTISASPTSFNPSTGQTTTVTYRNAVKATSVRIEVKNGSGMTVRTIASFSLLGTGTWTRVWDGKNSSGSIVPAGTYAVVFSGKDTSGRTLAPATTSVTVVSTATPPPSSGTGTLTVSASPTSFDPAAGKTTTITYKNTVKATSVRIEVKNGSGTTVRTIASFSLLGAGTWSRVWDGKNSSGSIVPTGTYTVVFSGKDTSGNTLAPATASVTVAGSTTPPPTTYAFKIGSITSGTIDTTLGQTTTVTYTVPTTTDLRVFVKNSMGTEVRTLAQVSGAAAGTRTATWDGKNGSGSIVPNGTYTVTVESLSSTPAITPASGTITVTASTPEPPPASGTLTVSASPTSFDPAAGQTTTITYKNTVKATSVRIDVKNSSGTTIRTVASFSLLGAGTWSRVWDGKNSSGSIVPAGTYTVEFSGKDESGATLTPATTNVTVAARTVTPTDPTPTDPAPPASDGAEKGQVIVGAGSSNWDWTKRAGYKMGIALQAPKSGTLTQVTLQWKKSTGYGAGNYGRYNFELHTNGTGNFPSGTIIARVNNVNPSTAMDGYLDGALRVPLTAQLTAGQKYHIVIYNIDPNPSSNFSSPNGLMTDVKPWDGTGNRTSYYSSGSWKPYGSTNSPWNTARSNNV
ncbi:MAG: FlgD immunoglobulin-like domain containing protein, partial [Armatimonadota bacterium]